MIYAYPNPMRAGVGGLHKATAGAETYRPLCKFMCQGEWGAVPCCTTIPLHHGVGGGCMREGGVFF